MNEETNKFTVKVNKRAKKNIGKMPQREQDLLTILIDDMRMSGPIRKNWANFSDLGEDKYHCHLSYKWVACWRWEKGSILIEVYYAGSREEAPY